MYRHCILTLMNKDHNNTERISEDEQAFVVIEFLSSCRMLSPSSISLDSTLGKKPGLITMIDNLFD